MATTTVEVDPRDLLPLRYYGGDPASLFQGLVDDARTLFGAEWSNFLGAGHGMILLQLLSRALWRLTFTADRNVGDAFARTVRTRLAANRIAKQLGYSPKGATSAGTDLTIGLGQAYGFDVTIPAGFEFQSDGLVWRTSQATTWLAGVTDTKQVAVTEGTSKSVSYTSDNTANQRFQIPIDRSGGEYLKDKSVAVTILGAVWTEQDTIPFTATNDYEVFYTADTPEVMLGSGTSGNIPVSGASVLIAYVVSKGLAGNIPKGLITSAVTPLVVGSTEIALTIAQSQAATGGLPDETVEQAMANATAVWKSRGVAVTAEDIAAQALAFSSSRYGRASVAKAVSLRGAGSDSELSGQLSLVRTTIGTPATTVKTQTDLIATKVTALQADRAAALAALDATVTDVAVDLDQIIAAMSVSTQDASGNLSNLESARALLLSEAQSALSMVNGIGTAGSSTLTTADKASLLSKIQRTIDESSVISTTRTAALGNIGSLNTSISQATTQRASAVANVYAGRAYVTGGGSMDLAIQAISTAKAAIVVAVPDLKAAVEPYLQAVYDHVDLLLAHDAKSNVVQVPILSRDASGFLAAPTMGLLRAIQADLETKKEPTVTIEVVDGSFFLVAVTYAVTGAYAPGSSKTDIEAEITARLAAMTKAFTFGSGVYLTDGYAALTDVPIAGLSQVTFKITGPTSLIDLNGNLPLSDDRIPTWGGNPTITLTPKVA